MKPNLGLKHCLVSASKMKKSLYKRANILYYRIWNGEILEKSRRYFLLIAILFLIAVLFFIVVLLMNEQKPAEPTYDELRAIWLKHGITAKNLNEAYSELRGLSRDELEEIKAQINSLRSRSTLFWLREIASIYSTAIDIEIEQRAIESLTNEIERMQNPCGNTAILAELIGSQERLIALADEYASKVKSFSENYPMQFEKLGLNNNINSAELRRLLSIQKKLVSGIEEECK